MLIQLYGDDEQAYYDSCRSHDTLRVTPAMAANVMDRAWDMEDIVSLLEAGEQQSDSALNTSHGSALGHDPIREIA